MRKRGPAELLVERVRVEGHQEPAAQSLQLRMILQPRNHRLGQSLSAMLFEHIDIGEVGKSGTVHHDASQANLLLLPAHRNAQAVRDRPLDRLNWNVRRPIAARQISMRRRDIDPGRIAHQLVAFLHHRHPRTPFTTRASAGTSRRKLSWPYGALSSTKLTGAATALSAWTTARDSAVG